jgi:2-amino-4-deoxychorismate synthase
MTDTATITTATIDCLEPPFALIRRAGRERLELLRGEVAEYRLLADLPRGDGPQLALVPFRQLRERGDECHDDGAPLLSLRIDSRVELAVGELPRPAGEPRLFDGAFDVSDEAYARQVAAVIEQEIATGEGANFVLRRTFTATCADALDTALGAFRNLLHSERNAYWTFLIHTGDRIMVGASPESHVRLSGGVAVMNPISGTLRKPPAAATRAEVLAFLADPKERDELAMVVDEELKMLAEVGGHGRVRGPFLKEMANLAHTEYHIEAATGMDPRDVLRATMFAPTATGSPIRNALRVIKRHETGGRGYYGGVAALIGPESGGLEDDGLGRGGLGMVRAGGGAEEMDACLMLRVAYVDPATGVVHIPVGATLVRGSDPAQEVLETHAKAAGVLRAFGVFMGQGGGSVVVGAGASLAGEASGRVVAAAAGAAAKGVTQLTAAGAVAAAVEAVPKQASSSVPAPGWAADPEVLAALASRNEKLAPFWLVQQTDQREPRLVGRTALIVDHEDAFTSMFAVQLRALGLDVTRTPFDLVGQDQDRAVADYDLVVLGPGPGDPRDLQLPKIRAGRALLQRLLAASPALVPDLAPALVGSSGSVTSHGSAALSEPTPLSGAAALSAPVPGSRSGSPSGGDRAVLGICLGHQMICAALGFELVRKARPAQGDQRPVELFGRTELVGFYNSFAALAPVGRLDTPAIEFAAGEDRELVALRARLGGTRLAGLQFHPESILTRDGLGILRDELLRLLAA